MNKPITCLIIVGLFVAGSAIWLTLAYQSKGKYDTLRAELEAHVLSESSLDAQTERLLTQSRESWGQRVDESGGVYADALKTLGLKPSVSNIVHFFTYRLPEYSFFSASRNKGAAATGAVQGTMIPGTTNRVIHVSSDGHLALVQVATNRVIVFSDDSNGLRVEEYFTTKVAEQDDLSALANAAEIAAALIAMEAYFNGDPDNRSRQEGQPGNRGTSGQPAVEFFQQHAISAESLKRVTSVGFVIPLTSGNPHVTPQHLSQIAQLPAMEKLSLESCKAGYGKPTWNKDHLAVLGQCDTLTELNLNDTYITDGELAGLSNISKLKKLHLASTKISDQGMKSLATIPTLEYVEVPGWITEKGIAALLQLKDLKGIEAWQIKGDVGKALEMLGTKKSLEVLKFGGMKITDANLSHLSQLNLQTLSLAHSDLITDSGIKSLHVPSLVSLNLGGCDQIGDGTLEHLEAATSLATLNLDSCSRISDRGLESLSRLKSLRVLTLSDCSVTDDGLKRLHGLKELKFVRLRRCPGVTADGLAALKGALPECEVAEQPRLVSEKRPVNETTDMQAFENAKQVSPADFEDYVRHVIANTFLGVQSGNAFLKISDDKIVFTPLIDLDPKLSEELTATQRK